MKYTVVVWTGLAALAVASACTQLPIESSAANTMAFQATPLAARKPDSAGYERRPPRDPNGIGRYYQGRQIAHVMGHEGADWLERSDRNEDEGTDILLRELALKPTDVVADIGAGTGYFSFRMARLVPQGKVLAVDIQPEMITELRERQRKNGLANVEPVLSTSSNPHLPASSLDLVLIVDAYHEFDHPREMARAIAHALRPRTGRLALVEYRAEDPQVPIKAIHKMTVDQAKKEMQAVGLKLVNVDENLPQQHLMFFQRQ
jgi:ubiquinone/menaquinone biosynthesis C-methylase UbiE